MRNHRIPVFAPWRPLAKVGLTLASACCAVSSHLATLACKLVAKTSACRAFAFADRALAGAFTAGTFRH